MTQHHIIIISESERLRDVMQTALAGDSYRISGISSSFADVHALAALRPDLLILDWLLGCEDHGLQLLQILQLCPQLTELPVIVCSAPIGLVREIERWLRGSSVQFLLKPFGLAELRHTLEGALGLAAREPGAVAAAAPATPDGHLPGERAAPREILSSLSPAASPIPLSTWERAWHATPEEQLAPDGGPVETPPSGDTVAVSG